MILRLFCVYFVILRLCVYFCDLMLIFVNFCDVMLIRVYFCDFYAYICERVTAQNTHKDKTQNVVVI